MGDPLSRMKMMKMGEEVDYRPFEHAQGNSRSTLRPVYHVWIQLWI